jgi:hypothetical protein
MNIDAAKQARDKVINDLGLAMTAVFVPWSLSRSRKDSPKLSDYSLNWRVALLKDGKEVLTTDYSAEIGHCKNKVRVLGRPTIFEANLIIAECEGQAICEGGITRVSPPKMHDVVHSIVLDSDVIEYGSFEQWASDFGYDPDSRKAEAIYKACLAHALKLRLAIGDAGIAQLREAFQDY